jgi:hypothetical protein
MHTMDLSFALILTLGGVHGVNPAMGWLFAVSLGLQEQRRAAVWGALAPLALGHALAIGAAVAVAAGLGLVVPVGALRLLAAAGLFGFGVFHLTRHRHPRWGGMRVGPKDLTIWSFLMASAHGAGLMVLPLVLGPGETGGHGTHGASSAARAAGAAGSDIVGHAGHLLAAGLPAVQSAGLAAMVVHTAGYLLVAGLIAVVVYEKLGLRLLRTAWINLNAIWAGALVLTAVLTLIV